MSLADGIAARLDAKSNGTGYKAKCPAHEDGHASLSIGTGNDGRVLFNCFAGCTAEEICQAMGLKTSELFPEESKRTRQNLTLGVLASAKKLPSDFLASLGLRDLADGGVGIPYRDKDGVEVALKRRTNVVAKEGSIWPKGKPLVAYGIDRLDDAREMDLLVLVEGESDCWTLWHHGIPALGIPGANSVKTLLAEHVSGVAAVYVIHEPDKGGDTFAVAVPKRLEEVGFSGMVRVVKLDAKDTGELYQRDPAGFKGAFEKALKGEPIATGFESVPDRLKGEREDRLARAKRIMSFGITFLDEALGGIFPNDLIIIGAASGEGKTALCTAIAHYNAKEGKRIHYFALEAEEREIERRMKYREISDLIYKDENCKHLRERLNYIDWYSGLLDAAIGPTVEAEVDAIVSKQFGTMKTFYKKQGGFGGNELMRLLLAVQDETDAAVVDHLHYVDVDDSESENRGVKKVVMRVRDASLMLGKAMFLVAHLRKKDRGRAALVPDLDDFHGTSEVPKVATKAIMIAKATDQDSGEPHLLPTYVYAPKCRMDGGRTRFCALMNFNLRTQTYEKKYLLGRLSFGLDVFEPIPNHKLPIWAKSAAR